MIANSRIQNGFLRYQGFLRDTKAQSAGANEAQSKSQSEVLNTANFNSVDFNKSAGLPNDFKIHPNTIESLLKTNENLGYKDKLFSKIDVFDSFKNAYEKLKDVLKHSYDESEFKELVGKITNGKNEPWWQADISEYKDSDGKIRGEALLVAFLASDQRNLKGEASYIGKLAGLDSNLDKEQLARFDSVWQDVKGKLAQTDLARLPEFLRRDALASAKPSPEPSSQAQGSAKEAQKLLNYAKFSMLSTLFGSVSPAFMSNLLGGKALLDEHL